MSNPPNQSPFSNFTQRPANGGQHKAQRRARAFGLLDVVAILAAGALIFCEFKFPLADSTWSEPASLPLFEITTLATPAADAANQFEKERDLFYQNTMGHSPEKRELAVEIKHLLDLEVKYLSYYQTAGAVLMDELKPISQLSNDIEDVGTPDARKALLNNLRSISEQMPALKDCLKTAADERSALDDVLRSANPDRSKVDIATLTPLPDLLRTKTPRWLNCRNTLADFDKELNVVTDIYPALTEAVEARAEHQKRIRTIVRWLATLTLAYCAGVYRRKWMKIASSTFGA